MTYEAIRYEVDGPVATITLSRPEVLNAFNGPMKYDLLDGLDRADADESVRAVIITGEGRAFCSGADLSAGGGSFKDDRTEGARRPDGSVDYDHPAIREGSGDIALRFYQLNKPVIGAINGPCAGMGTSVPLTFDIRLASETAFFAFLFAKRGMLPECASTWHLPRLVGISKALEWCYTGRKVSAREALTAGLVSEVLPPEQLLPRARALALEIAEGSAPVSATLMRHMFWRALGLDHPMEAHRIESWGAFHRSRSPDAQEGAMAFLERRAPEFNQRVPADLPDFFPWWNDARYE